jgi:molecular chaperone IbpA
MAIAGFGEDDIEVSQKERNLTVKGKIEGKDDEKTCVDHFVHRGIANRSFERTFRLGEHVLVKDAILKNGMLTIDLEQEIPEAEKPKVIPITVN